MGLRRWAHGAKRGYPDCTDRPGGKNTETNTQTTHSQKDVRELGNLDVAVCGQHDSSKLVAA